MPVSECTERHDSETRSRVERPAVLKRPEVLLVRTRSYCNGHDDGADVGKYKDRGLGQWVHRLRRVVAWQIH